MTSCKLGWCSCWTHMWSNQTYDYSIRLILCWRGRHLSDRAKNDKSDKARGFTLENIPCLLIVLLPLRADYTLQKPLMFWRFPLISYVDTNDNWLLWGYTLNMVLYLVVLFEEQWFIKIPRRVCQKNSEKSLKAHRVPPQKVHEDMIDIALYLIHTVSRVGMIQ